jgi:hypothetical protein
MVPNTFEAVAVGNASREGFPYIVGYVDKIKRKNDDDFVPMSEAAGVDGGDEGVVMAGAVMYPPTAPRSPRSISRRATSSTRCSQRSRGYSSYRMTGR